MKKIYLLPTLILTIFANSGAHDYLRPFAPYYSQCGQDKFLNEQIFKDKRNGFFVEIGAHDGIGYSNTYYFEKLGWKGICIEPHPEVFNKLKLNRSCTCLQLCVSNVNGQVDFLKVNGHFDEIREYPEMLSGIYQSYDPKHLLRVEKEIKAFGGSVEHIKVESSTLRDIFKDHNVHYVDFLSIDTEGNEYDILTSIDFSKVTIKTIAVEVNFKSTKIYDFLTSRGYVLLKRIGGDEVYCREGVNR
jgi:FkbM family methyltransferase